MQLPVKSLYIYVFQQWIDVTLITTQARSELSSLRDESSSGRAMTAEERSILQQKSVVTELSVNRLRETLLQWQLDSGKMYHALEDRVRADKRLH